MIALQNFGDILARPIPRIFSQLQGKRGITGLKSIAPARNRSPWHGNAPIHAAHPLANRLYPFTSFIIPFKKIHHI
jgi:hypothetical protein